MNDYEVRGSIRRLVFGPVIASLSFWLEIMLLVAAAFELEHVWQHIRQSPAMRASLETPLFLMLFILVFASYIYFTDLVKLRKHAQSSSDEETREVLCRSADMTAKMFYFGAGSMIVGLQLCLMVIYSMK